MLAKTRSLRHKTQFCNKLIESGKCPYGLNCRFAHSNLELNSVFSDPSYKTKFCNQFHKGQGICYYGRRCNFIHNNTKEMLKKEIFELNIYQAFANKYDKEVFNLILFRKIEDIKISEKDYINTIFESKF